MRQKLFSLLSLSIFTLFALVLVSGMVSADIKFVPPSINQTISSGQTSVTVNFQLNNTGTVNYTSLVWSGTSNVGSWTILPTLTILNTTEIISLNATLSSIPSTYVGTINANINVNNSGSPTEDLPITITVQSPPPTPTPEEIQECDATGNLGSNLKVKIKDISVERGYGKDNDWFPFDEVEVKVEIENNGDENIDNIVVEWGLYNEQTNEWYMDGEEDDFNLKKDKEKTLIIPLKLDEDIDELEDGDFVLYVWANGDDDEFNGDETCESTSEDIKAVIENDFVILDNIKALETLSCGSELQITADVWNIGEDDQEGVSVIITSSKELGINKKVEIGDIDSFDSEKLDATIKMPEEAEEKTYYLRLSVYDEDDDVYITDYDDDESVRDIHIKLEGSCAKAEPKLAVFAVLESGGKAEEDMVIKATFTNTGEKLATYSLNAAAYSEWASSVELSNTDIILGAGESTNVLITFAVKQEASGDYLFDIEAISEGQLVLKQPVSVTIEESAKAKGITGKIISGIGGENWYLWAIGILNIVLVVIIIVVALRVARK